MVHWKSLSRVQLFVTSWTIYSPWNSLGQNTRVGSLSLFQEIFPTQGSNPGIELRSPTLRADSLPSKAKRKSLFFLVEANSTPMV